MPWRDLRLWVMPVVVGLNVVAMSCSIAMAIYFHHTISDLKASSFACGYVYGQMDLTKSLGGEAELKGREADTELCKALRKGLIITDSGAATNL